MKHNQIANIHEVISEMVAFYTDKLNGVSLMLEVAEDSKKALVLDIARYTLDKVSESLSESVDDYFSDLMTQAEEELPRSESAEQPIAQLKH